MTYSFEGAFIREIIPETRPGTFVSMGNGQFMTWTFMQKESNGEFYRIFFHDGAGKTIRYVSEPKKKYDFSRGISIMTPLLTPAPGGYLYNSWENDTIFRAATDGSFVPAFSWLPGRLKMPIDGSRDYARFLREKDNYILDLNAFESLSKWLVRYDYHGRENLALYDKRSRDFFVVANADTAGHGIRNDIDGGPSFFPSWDNENGHHFIKLLNAIDLSGYQKDASVRGIQPRDPAAAEKFRKMADSLTANSNPVVMMVEIK
jgi:hypothetical protein